MPKFLNALLCGVVAVIAAHVTYVQSNLFIVGDVVRPGRHPLFDPMFFDLVGLGWGLVVGGACAAWLSASAPWKPVLLGLGVTLAGIAIVGGGTTFSQYRDLPQTARLAGRDVFLEFEMRLPPGQNTVGEVEMQGRFGWDRNTTDFTMTRQAMRVVDGRHILRGRLQLKHAETPRLLTIVGLDGYWRNFQLPMAAEPTEADTAWTDWFAALADIGNQPATERHQIRYRVQFGPNR